ncbi:MAG: hypothetical protein Q6J68_02065 [Thermostichales cyanobacterium SZTDM-1c_bins_54]
MKPLPSLLTLLLSLALGIPALGRENRCHLPLELWAEHLSEQLPLFVNLAQGRAGLSGYTLLVGQAETRPFTPAELAAYGIPQTPDRVAWLYLTTWEQRLQPPKPDRRSFFFRLILARRQDWDPWQLVRVEMLTLEGQTEEVSDGLVAQAVRLWQRQGCPAAADYRL